MKLTAFNYGITEIHEKMAFEDGDENKKIPIALLYFLIETADKKILIDVGCDTMPGFKMYDSKLPVDVLRSYCLAPSDITDIVITHSHLDHIGSVRHYPDANVYLHEAAYPASERFLTENSKVQLFKEDFYIADGILVKFIGGHSKGSCIVIIESQYGTYVLCGDECYTRDNLTLKKPTGSPYCLENATNFVLEYSKDCYKTILFHERHLVENIGFKTIFED